MTADGNARFKGIFVLAGLPWALLLALVVSSHSPVSWPDFALTTLLAGAAFASALGTVAWVFTRHVRRTWAGVAGFFLVMPTAGLLAATLIYLAANSIPHGKWTRLPDPPEAALNFAGPQCYTDGEVVIYVQAASGHAYAYQDALTSNAGNWTPVPEVPASAVHHLPTCDLAPLTRIRGPWLRGSAAATYQVEMRGADCGSHVHFLLRDDQSIWSWSRSSCTLGELGFAIVMAVATLAASLLAALAVVLLKPPVGWPRSHTPTST